MIRHLKNIEEFEALDAIYQHCFGEHSVPSDCQKEWWMQANTHILALFESETLIGGASFWSIKPQCFEKLKSGQCRERDITVADFDFVEKNRYYLSDIAILTTYRNQQYANVLVNHVLQQIATNANPDNPLQLLAFGFSEGGSKILRNLGFEKIKEASETLDHQDLYLLELESSAALHK